MNSSFSNNCASKIHKKAPVCPCCLDIRDVEWGPIRHSFPRGHGRQPVLPKGWSGRFGLIERAGGANLRLWRRLTAKELLTVFFNPWALLLGPFYVAALGMWRQALAFSVTGLASMGLLVPFQAQVLAGPAWPGWPGLPVWVGMVWLVAAVRVNLDFYRHWHECARQRLSDWYLHHARR